MLERDEAEEAAMAADIGVLLSLDMQKNASTLVRMARLRNLGCTWQAGDVVAYTARLRGIYNRSPADGCFRLAYVGILDGSIFVTVDGCATLHVPFAQLVLDPPPSCPCFLATLDGTTSTMLHFYRALSCYLQTS